MLLAHPRAPAAPRCPAAECIKAALMELLLRQTGPCKHALDQPADGKSGARFRSGSGAGWPLGAAADALSLRLSRRSSWARCSSSGIDPCAPEAPSVSLRNSSSGARKSFRFRRVPRSPPTSGTVPSPPGPTSKSAEPREDPMTARKQTELSFSSRINTEGWRNASLGC